jgi:hypothetical protein
MECCDDTNKAPAKAEGQTYSVDALLLIGAEVDKGV